MANIDRLRIPAAIGLVWFHADGAPIVGSADRARMSAFVVLGLKKAAK